MLKHVNLQMQQKMRAGKPNQPANRPVLPDAIDITVRTIEGRARLYRNLVVAVSAVSVLSILLAVLFRQWLALTGLVLLVPSVSVSFLISEMNPEALLPRGMRSPPFSYRNRAILCLSPATNAITAVE